MWTNWGNGSEINNHTVHKATCGECASDPMVKYAGLELLMCNEVKRQRLEGWKAGRLEGWKASVLVRPRPASVVEFLTAFVRLESGAMACVI